MNCPLCGERIPDGSDFCIACGNEIGDPTATQQINKTEVKTPLDASVPTLDASVPTLDASDPIESGASQVADFDSVFAPFMTDEAPSWDDEIMVAQSTGDMANLFQPLEVTYANDVEPMAYLPSGEHMKTKEYRKRKVIRRISVVVVGLVVCVAAVLVVAPIVLPMRSGADEAEAVSETEEPVAQAITTPSAEDGVIKVNLNVPGLGEDGSRIPIHVEGELRDGTAYAQDLFLMPGETQFKLPVGLYEVSISASPINAEGFLYNYSDHTLLLAIGDDGSVTYDPKDFVFELEIKDSADTTYEDIDNATNWIRKDPDRAAVADELANRARAKVDEAIRIREAESQRTSEATTNNSNNDDNTSDSTYNTTYDTTGYSYQEDYSDSQDQQTTSNDSSSSGSGEVIYPTPLDSGGSSDSGSQTGDDTTNQ